MSGTSYGRCVSYLYETKGCHHTKTFLVVWLHGEDEQFEPEETEETLCAIANQLGVKCYFIAPVNPQQTNDGKHFMWAVSYQENFEQ